MLARLGIVPRTVQGMNRNGMPSPRTCHPDLPRTASPTTVDEAFAARIAPMEQEIDKRLAEADRADDERLEACEDAHLATPSP
jgi:hypothetical protein